MSWVRGIDISKHQAEADLDEVAEAGYNFCILKCSEGATYLDPRFEERWAELMDMDPSVMVRGAYHFARPDNRTEMSGRQAGETEARWFAKCLKKVTGYQAALPPWLDWEKYTHAPERTDGLVTDNSPTARRNRDWVEGFINVIEGELCVPCGIYTGPKVWEGTLRNFGDLFVEQPLWVVDYGPDGFDQDGQPDRMPKRESLSEWPWLFWQWSGGGSLNYVGGVPGVSGACDVNNFNGTLDELIEVANVDPGGPPLVPAPGPAGGIMAPVDLDVIGSSYDPQTAMVQGLLLAWGFGPSGLVGSDGKPDGKAGSKTLGALADFKRGQGLAGASTEVDAATWHRLLSLRA